MTRRGAILFELLVAMAIFIAAAALTLGAVRNGYESMRRAHQRQLAVDLARSKLAELEAGLISIAQLQSGAFDRIGSIDLMESASDLLRDDDLTQWNFEVITQPTSYPGLTLVEIRVYQPDDLEAERPTILRQLMRVRPERGTGEDDSDPSGGGDEDVDVEGGAF